MQKNPADRNDKPIRSIVITKCGGMRLRKPDAKPVQEEQNEESDESSVVVSEEEPKQKSSEQKETPKLSQSHGIKKKDKKWKKKNKSKKSRDLFK